MADGSLLLIFRSQTTKDLAKRQKLLLKQMTTLSSQSVGQKSFTRDLRHLKEQLEAITFVLNERSGTGYEPFILTDFSGVGSAPPAGTAESLSS